MLCWGLCLESCSQGVFVPREQDKRESEEVRFMINVNLMGTFHFIKTSLPRMRRIGRASKAIISSQTGQETKFGWQIVVGSIAGFFGAAFGSAGGVGRGGIFVAMLSLLIGFNPKSAATISKCTSTKAFLKGVETWKKETIMKKEAAKRLGTNGELAYIPLFSIAKSFSSYLVMVQRKYKPFLVAQLMTLKN